MKINCELQINEQKKKRIIFSIMYTIRKNFAKRNFKHDFNCESHSIDKLLKRIYFATFFCKYLYICMFVYIIYTSYHLLYGTEVEQKYIHICISFYRVLCFFV